MKRAWFVGSIINNEDKTQHFVDEGIWENGYDDRYLDEVKSIQKGDRIAIKASYTRKHNLPFENKGRAVSVMGIKAIGTVTHNYNDGKKIGVDWQFVNPVKEWYFFTARTTIWKVEAESGWMHKNLIDFTFNDEDQDIDRFLNHTYWKSKYVNVIKEQYLWTSFYEEMAAALLKYRNNRVELLEGINEMFNRLQMKNPLTEMGADGTRRLLKDVCPFTVFGLFNKGITDNNRKKIMSEIANFLNVEEEVPNLMEGVPVLNNMKSRFFYDEGQRKDDDIDNLWELFSQAIDYAEHPTVGNKQDFIEIYDKVRKQIGIKWNITMGLYWIKPWSYITLDQRTRVYLADNLQILESVPQKLYSGKVYLELVDQMLDKFDEKSYPVHSFPELSYKAWLNELTPDDEDDPVDEELPSYTRKDFLQEVFIEEDKYDTIASLLERKKNLILQGPPGVGKTFAAKKLAYSLIGEEDDARIKLIQFHQSYSYEDFVMGYRPSENGFELKKGPFYNFCVEAAEDPNNKYYFIIDEINRGNLSKIFGELLMLIEGDKRGEKMSLTYSDELFFVPGNVYIIGMMNTADRSLAMIDYALRRRFSFVDLEPAFGSEKFKEHLLSQGAEKGLVEKIQTRMERLNEEITRDVNLGQGFRIGHSYFSDYNDTANWYKEVITYEITPLLHEYWFDEEDKAKKNVEELLR